MGSSGFKHLDFLNCCKFAEGDSRVLMQKMVRPPRCTLAAPLLHPSLPRCTPLSLSAPFSLPAPNFARRPAPPQARDRLRQFAQDHKANVTPPASHAAETELCSRLGGAMAAAKGDKALELVLWDDNWQTVYALAEATMARTMSEFMDE